MIYVVIVFIPPPPKKKPQRVWRGYIGITLSVCPFVCSHRVQAITFYSRLLSFSVASNMAKLHTRASLDILETRQWPAQALAIFKYHVLRISIISCSDFVWLFLVSLAFIAGSDSQPVDTDSPSHLVSPLTSRSLWLSTMAVVSVSHWHCISSLVFYIDSYN